MSETFCPIPWTHSSVQTNGDMRVCCQVVDPPYSKLRDETGQMNAATHSVSAGRNAPMIRDMRSKLLNGQRHSACRICWQEEDNGLPSKRKMMNGIYPEVQAHAEVKTQSDGSIQEDDFPVRYFDLRFGNRCNLKCRSCGPTESSAWYDDWVKIHEKSWNSRGAQPYFNYYGQNNYYLKKTLAGGWTAEKGGFKWYEEGSPYWKEIAQNLEQIDRFYFTGGEPTIIKQHWQLLDLCIEQGFAGNITLEYNTNVMTLPPIAEEKWSHFKGVEVGCSVDGIESVAEYVRFPSRWDIVRNNLMRIDRMGNNVTALLAPTISVFNIYHLPDMIRWQMNSQFEKFGFYPGTHTLEHPPYLNSQILPPKAKQMVADKFKELYSWIEDQYGDELANNARESFNGVLNYMCSRDQSDRIEEFLKVTDQIDGIRGQQLGKYIPELPELIRM